MLRNLKIDTDGADPLPSMEHTPFDEMEDQQDLDPEEQDINPMMTMGGPVPGVELSGQDPALEFVWSQFKVWDVTATLLKKVVFQWQKWVLILVIFGSFAAIFSNTLLDLGQDNLAQGLVIMSAFSVAICTFANSRILTDENSAGWMRARAVAETFKSEAYLYQLKAAPYNGEEPENVLFERSQKVMKSVSDISPEISPADFDIKEVVPADLSFESYLEERVRGQLNYYQKKAQHFHRLLKRVKNLGFLMGFIGVIMGTISANGNEHISVWMAFLNGMTASIASFNASRKYEEQLLSFRSTSFRMVKLLSKSQQVPVYDIDAQRDFVVSCEKVLSAENKAWVEELSE